MTIGERIKERRKQLGLTVDELAERLGKNRATIYRYESNDIEKLPTTVLEPLAKALDVTPAYLMGWDTDNIVIKSFDPTKSPNYVKKTHIDESQVPYSEPLKDYPGAPDIKVLPKNYLPGGEISEPIEQRIASLRKALLAGGGEPKKIKTLSESAEGYDLFELPLSDLMDHMSESDIEALVDFARYLVFKQIKKSPVKEIDEGF